MRYFFGEHVTKENLLCYSPLPSVAMYTHVYTHGEHHSSRGFSAHGLYYIIFLAFLSFYLSVFLDPSPISEVRFSREQRKTCELVEELP